MGLDGWVCCGIGVAADGLGERGGVLVALSVLFDEISRVLSVETVPAFVSGSCGLGSSLGVATDSDEAWLRDVSGGGPYPVDDSVAWSRYVDLQLGADLAYVVHGSDGSAIRCEMTEEWTA